MVVVVVVAALVAPATAQANRKTVADGDDVSGSLDIRSVSHGHRGTRLTHTLRTYAPFAGRLLRNDNVIGFAFDTSGTRSSVERYAFVFWESGRLHAIVIRPNGRFVASARVSRPSSRSVKVKLSRRSLGNPPGYRWFGFTTMGENFDVAPNRRSILHDITPPTINFPRQPLPADTTYDVTFRVSDTGGAGLRSWRLQLRRFGATRWATIASGTSGGSKEVSVEAAQGDDHQYRVVAVDRHGNRRTSVIRTISLPVDDTDASLLYVAGPSGLWTTSSAIAGAFLGTLHATSTSGDAFTYTFDGGYVALVGPGTCAGGTVSIDGVAEALSPNCSGRQRRVLYAKSLSRGSHTLVFTLEDGSFSLDGIVSR